MYCNGSTSSNGGQYGLFKVPFDWYTGPQINNPYNDTVNIVNNGNGIVYERLYPTYDGNPQFALHDLVLPEGPLSNVVVAEKTGRAYGAIPVIYGSSTELFGIVDGMTGKHHPQPASKRAWGALVGRVVASTGQVETPVTVDRGYVSVDLAGLADPAVYGVVASVREDGRLSVNSVGEGCVWVIMGDRGSIPVGTLLQSSGIWGLAEVQSDQRVRSCTVAKTVGEVVTFDRECDRANGLLRPQSFHGGWSVPALRGVANQWGIIDDDASAGLYERIMARWSENGSVRVAFAPVIYMM